MDVVGDPDCNIVTMYLIKQNIDINMSTGYDLMHENDD